MLTKWFWLESELTYLAIQLYFSDTMATTTIPEYFVYGEKARALDVGFLHVELVSSRYFVHRGKVAPHKHPGMAQLTFWLKGGGTYFIDDADWTFSSPAASLVLADEVHGFNVSQGSDAIVLSLETEALEKILVDAGLQFPRAIFVKRSDRSLHWPALHQAMRNLLEEYTTQHNHWARLVNYYAAAAIINLMRICDHKKEDAATAKAHPLAQQLKILINLHFRENWMVERYVRELGSSGHMTLRAAKRSFGSTIKGLITQRRVQEARRLLAFTIRSVEDISYELGFQDPAYFSREFKKHTGLAPGLWRSRNNRGRND